MKRREGGISGKAIGFVALYLLLLLHSVSLVCAESNEVVKDGGAEECVEIQLPVEKQQQIVSEDEVISVSMPLKTPFTMNPTKSFGEEQIWSPVFHFQNNSSTAVEVIIKNIRYILKEDSEVVTHYQPFDSLEERKRKEIYLCLQFGEAEVPVGDLSREYRFTLAEAGAGARAVQEFSIAGMMSCYPEQEWLDGDVAIAFQVEYKAVQKKQAEPARKPASDNKKPEEETGKEQAAQGEQPTSENTAENSLAEVTGTEWQKDLIGAVLTERKAVSGENEIGNGENEKKDAANTERVRAYIIDSSRTGGIAARQEESDEKEEFPFEPEKMLDDYEKYADAIPEGAALLLDVNETAENPAAYVMEESLKGLGPDMENGGETYVFWKNPDYVPEENKVWHIDGDIPYYISNPEQPWLWAALREEVLPEAEPDPVFIWVKKEKTDGAKLGTERNAVHGPGNDTGDTAAE